MNNVHNKYYICLKNGSKYTFVSVSVKSNRFKIEDNIVYVGIKTDYDERSVGQMGSKTQQTDNTGYVCRVAISVASYR